MRFIFPATRHPPWLIIDLVTRVRSLRRAVDLSFEHMPWLRSADEGSMSLCRQYASQIDAAVRSGDRAMILRSLYLGPHLSNLLHALGGTPAGRKSLPLAAPPSAALAALRASLP